ncbi:S8 family serine peptidase [Nitrosomonas sp.]|uniref:S8 family serine peptidase n=1 Tax=Nitrosomonas sp. TaxID=42353 RepID=UPI0025DF9BE0|nr:S8 family serine peptidase [Nitrosomonas sp.]MBY0484352.1 S8 family serine peptidase [Nitrosomonas sp.]
MSSNKKDKLSDQLKTESDLVANQDVSEISSTLDAKPTKNVDDTLQIEVIQSRPQEFIISPKRTHGQAAIQMLANGENLVKDLKAYAGLDIEIVNVRKKIGIDTQAVDGETAALLVSIDPQKGREFVNQSTLPTSPIWVDENFRITCSESITSLFSAQTFVQVSDGGASGRLDICILGESGKPLSNSSVKLYTPLQLVPIVGITNEDGVASFQLPEAMIASIAGLVIEPESMHWSKIVRNPIFKAGKINNIRVQSYADFDKNLYASGALSWGVGKLGVFDESRLVGRGVKIGIIDSGCDATHQMLSHVTKGVDFNRGGSAESWKIDEIGHGTHVAGIIGARYSDGSRLSFRGVAPEAELYIYKIFPQGDFFTMGAALEAAIADKVDIINMSLGSKDFSNDIAECINKAKNDGIACFVAAGNSGDAVQFPANLTTSIAVSAIGHKAYLPIDSVSANTFVPNLSEAEGFFSPSFTCFGNSIDFAGPGVGIISTVPRGGIKVLDGTSMAAPHLTGLAALYLGESNNMSRTATRVDYIYDCLKRMVKPMAFASERIGVGMPCLAGGSSPLRRTSFSVSGGASCGW